MMRAIVVTLTTSLLLVPVTKPFFLTRNYSIRNNNNDRHRSQQHQLAAHSLTTALESLADDRCNRDAAYRRLEWFDPTTSSTEGSTTAAAGNNDTRSNTTSSSSSSFQQQLPLYPLPTVYLPNTGLHHTLNNVEPRNIQMALDFLKNSQDNNNNTNSPARRFCAALCAVDTGKIASVGTILRVVDMDIQEHRIVVTCVPEALVDIVDIVNPQAATRENRLRRSSEYLVARVQRRQHDAEEILDEEKQSDDKDSEEEKQRLQTIRAQLANDYNAVRSMLIAGIGAENLPPFSRGERLAESLPILSEKEAADLCDTADFWKTAQVWQTLCLTVREGRQMQLAGDRNEAMVAAAIKKGGPLKLPIHLSELSKEDRRKVEEMDVQTQQDWVKLGLDPCLDFQVLLTMDRYSDRLVFLSNMVARERKRLEQLALLQPVDSAQENREAPSELRQGAWFEE